MDSLEGLCTGRLPIEALPAVSPRSLAFFVCSTFTDFVQERRVLQEQAYPVLTEYCKQMYGIQFRAVDLRLGVEEMVWEDLHFGRMFDRMRNNYCISSADCCPVILLGQKYGLPLLPKRIPSSAFELLRATLRAHRNSVTRQYHILSEWYKRDENAASEPEHELTSVTDRLPNLLSTDPELQATAARQWKDTRAILSQLIKIGFAICLREGTMDEELVYNILTFELDSGVTHMLRYSQDSRFQPLVFQREIIDLKNYMNADTAGDFIDLEVDDNSDIPKQDLALADLLKELQSRLASYYPSTNSPFSVLWRFPDGIEIELHHEYLQDFCQAFIENAKEAIDSRAMYRQELTSTPAIRVFDQAWSHLNMVNTLQPFATGHDSAVQQVVDYVLSPENQQTLVITGPVDAGKAPILCRVFVEMQQVCEDNNLTNLVLIPRVYMYPTTLSDALDSLHQQIRYLVPDLPEAAPASLTELVSSLPSDLEFVLLLAGTERLLDSDDELVPISSLCMYLPSNVKLVLTTTDSGVSMDAALVSEVQGFQPEDYARFLEGRLHDRNRVLTKEQWSVVEQMLPQVENLFHASLLDQELGKLRSFDKVSLEDLPTSNEDSFKRIFAFLEEKYGRTLVSRVSSYITASYNGLTDIEIEDILSMDDDILRELSHSEKCNARRFPTVIWLLLKNDMRILLTEFSEDGHFLSYWVNGDIAQVVQTRYVTDQLRVSHHYNMADYFLGIWHGTPKPIKDEDLEEPMAVDRLLPSQEVKYCNGDNVFFNFRQYRQLPRHLQLSSRAEELNTLVLFNYDWLYYKARSVGLDEMLKDFEIADQNIEISLVEETIRKSLDILRENLNNLSAELSGQLISYTYLYNNVKKLVRQCDVQGSAHNAFVPTYPYPKLPGSALQSTVVCPSALQSIHLDNDSGALFVKLENDSKLYNYSLNRGELSSELVLSSGELFTTSDQSHAVLVDSKHKKTMKVHKLEDGSFVGQIIPVNWIETLPFEEKHTFQIQSVDVGTNLVAAILSSKVSYIVVGNVETCKPVHIFRPEKRATMVKLTPDGKHLFTSSSEQLLGFEIGSGQQTAAVDLQAKPRTMLLNTECTRAFIHCEDERRVVILHLKEGYIDMSYKIVFESTLDDDMVTDIRISQNQKLLLVRGQKNVLVYDFSDDTIVTHLKRPPEIPSDFKLPNSEYVTLNFTEADFAFEDKVVVTSIFRDVLVWGIADGRPIVMLHAPVGIITKLVVDQKRNGLIGYVGHSREIHLWNLNGAFTDGTVIDALTDSIASVKPAINCPKAVAICSCSDEMGVVDLQTGFLTDLYTHEGQVTHCAISSCGNYAVVAIKPKRPNTANIVWSLNERRILKEFGNVSGHYVPRRTTSDFIHVSQEAIVYNMPYNITIISCADGEATLTTAVTNIQYVLTEPFLTTDDKRLILLTATDYVHNKAYYLSPTILVWNVENGMQQQINANTLSNFTYVRRILDVRSLPMQEAGIVVLYSTEEADNEDCADPSSIQLPISVLLVDVATMSALHVSQDIIPASTSPRDLQFSSDGLLVVDHLCHLYNLQDGSHVGQIPPAGLTFRGFALKNSVCLISQARTLFVFRLSEGAQIGKVDVHETITTVSKLEDDRTIVIGCESGNVLSYTIIDAAQEDVPVIVQAIPSREILDKERTRSWDRRVDEKHDGKGDGEYSRPPSISAGRRPKLADIPIPTDEMRPASDTLAASSRARSCSLM